MNRDSSECVVLLHGLARGRGSFWLVEKALKKRGYVVVNVNYPSTTAPIAHLADHVGLAVERCGSRRIHFVTHSMGGILVRHWLASHRPPHLGRVVMLGPPNHGSPIVDAFGDMRAFAWINGPAGLELGTSSDAVPGKLPRPDYSIGIIAGDISINPIFNSVLDEPNDGKVAVRSTRLEGAEDHIVIHATHTFMTFNPIVVVEILNFLASGAFNHALTLRDASQILTALLCG